MNTLRKVIGNTVISLLGQAVTWTSTLLLTIAYGRYLGDVQFGELYFASTFVGLVGFPIDAGFDQQMIRDVAREPSKAPRYFTNILCFKVTLWVGLYGCMLLLAWLLGYPPEVRNLITICGIAVLTSSLTSLMSSLNYTFEKVIFSVTGNILEKGLDAAVGVILLYNGANVQVMALILLGGSAVNLLWQTFWTMRMVGLPRTFDAPLARSLIRASIPFILNGAIAVIYYRIDTILLSTMTSTAVIGWYGAAYRLFDTLVFLPSLVINTIMYPVFSKLSAHSERELRVAVEKSLNFLLFCCIPITAGLIVVAPSIIGFLYHRSDFANAAPALQFLAPGLLFLYVNSVLTSVLISTGREKKISIMAIIALVFNLGFNLLLIPLYQDVGAALMTSLTEALLMCTALFFIPRFLWPTGSIPVALKAFAATALMGVVVWFMQNLHLNLLIIILVAALVYFPAATLLGTIPREDMNAVFASIRNKAGRGKAGGEEAGFADVPWLTEEEMGQEQGLQFVLAHEMTSPLLPAFKFEMTSVLPAFRSEMTVPLMPVVRPNPPMPATKREMINPTPIYKRGTVPLSMLNSTKIEDRETQLLHTPPSPKSIDDEETMVMKAVRPRKTPGGFLKR